MITVNTRESFLKVLKRMLRPKSIGVEIGVLHGDFSQMILDIVNPKMIVLIDPYKEGGECYGETFGNLKTAYSTETDYQNLRERFKKQISSYQVGIIKDFSYNAVKMFDVGSLDFAYFDGSHLYNDVKKDLNDWLPNIKENGILAGHDYVSISNFGVIQAVDEFSKEQGFEMVLFNDHGGDWALQKIKA